MKREILFRGFAITEQIWLYGNLNIFADGTCTISFKEEDDKLYSSPVVPESVGQYTGRISPKGTKMFEGDIVLHGASVREVIYYNTNFSLKRSDNAILLSFSKDPEIIGNTYQNPELLC